ncbi:universal stress protein [Streptomyces sp. NPDC006289]|uniref:universal stress protein n=1 Tax=Streptomyces sp. NPDC006289 TaxID=3156744 RepID=UPI0033A3D675
MTAVTVGVNGSPESFAAVRWAAREAVVRELPLRVIHVQDWPAHPEHIEHIAGRPLAPEPLPPPGRSREAEHVLREAVRIAELHQPGVRVRTDDMAGEGLAAQVLLTEAGSGGADLLVLGSRGLDSLTGFLIGSTSLPVAAASECPVVLVRGHGHGDTDAGDNGSATGKLILGIGLKRSTGNDELLSFGCAEAARRNSRLQILHAWSLPAMYTYAETADPGIGDELAGHISQTLNRTVEPWRERFPDVSIEAKAVVGAPGAELVYASPGADLLIVGRRTRTLPVGPRLGHVAHAAIHHATSPVAVVPHA